MIPLAVFIGAVTPAAAGVIIGRLAGGPVAIVAVVSFSSAINAIWPVGGGMAVDGTYRVRLGTLERTFDAQRSRGESLVGPLLLAAVTVGGFFLFVPPVVLIWRSFGSIRPAYEELLAIAGLVSMVVIGLARNARELPLRRWREAIEAVSTSTSMDRQAWADRVRRIAAIARPDGGIGHVGGIGARTVGLHEVLDAERILRGCVSVGISEAAPLRERCLRYLRTQQIPGGFPVYPGGMPRPGITTRATAALAA